MSVNVPASSDYEAEANRVRKQIDETVKQLRSRLTPSSLASEAAMGVGLTDVSWADALGLAVRRHPIPTAVVGLGLAAWTFSALRNRSRRDGVAGLTSPLRETSASLVDSATRVFRERAALKRRELVRVAQAGIADGAAKLADEVERKLDDVVDQIPGGTGVRPLVAAAIQIALTAALEGLLRKDPRYP